MSAANYLSQQASFEGDASERQVAAV